MKQAMIFAAGLGTRLKPLTDTMPKALVPVGGQPLLRHIIEKMKTAGFERIVVNVHHFAPQIIDYLHDNHHFGLDILISDETEHLLETGGGIKKALPLFDPYSPILIHNVDILSNADLSLLYEWALQSHPDALLLVSQRITKRYLLFEERSEQAGERTPAGLKLDGWTNIETGEVRSPYPLSSLPLSSLKQLAFSGIHILSPQVFPLFANMPDRFGIIDFYLKHCHQCTFMGFEQTDLQLLDVGKLDTLEQAEQFISHSSII